jgi:hypothetical protein
MTIGQSDILSALQNGVQAIRALNKTLGLRFESATFGSFTWAGATSSVSVSNPAVLSTSIIVFTPTNASAGSLTGSNKAPYVSAKTPGTGFTLTTANGTNAAGTETFDYIVVNLV